MPGGRSAALGTSPGARSAPRPAALRVEDLRGRRRGRLVIRVDERPPDAARALRLDPCRAGHVGEEHLLHEEVRHALGALDVRRAGREAREHVRERVRAEQLLRLGREADEERVHHDDGGLAFEERLQREERVGGLLESLHPRDEVEPPVLERVRELVREERVLEKGAGREAERGRDGRRLGRALGDDEELPHVRVVETRDLARVELRDLLLEAGFGSRKPTAARDAA